MMTNLKNNDHNNEVDKDDTDCDFSTTVWDRNCFFGQKYMFRFNRYINHKYINLLS